jgi:hypothetical protein
LFDTFLFASMFHRHARSLLAAALQAAASPQAAATLAQCSPLAGVLWQGCVAGVFCGGGNFVNFVVFLFLNTMSLCHTDVFF